MTPKSPYSCASHPTRFCKIGCLFVVLYHTSSQHPPVAHYFVSMQRKQHQYLYCIRKCSLSVLKRVLIVRLHDLSHCRSTYRQSLIGPYLLTIREHKYYSKTDNILLTYAHHFELRFYLQECQTTVELLCLHDGNFIQHSI